MRKPSENIKVLAAILLIVALASTAAALTYYIYHQTLTVPGLKVYEHGTSYEIPTGSDITDKWLWNGTSFILIIDIKNVGTTTLTTSIPSPTITGWTFTVAGTGTLEPNQIQVVNITATPESLIPGATTGPFDISIDAS